MLLQRVAERSALDVHPFASPALAPPGTPARRAVLPRSCVVLLVTALLAVVIACGGSKPIAGDGGPPAVTVLVSPATVNLAAGATQQFTASVAATDNKGVTWSASGGTITSDGLFTAPAVGGGYAIRATSAVEPGASGVALASVTGDGAVVEPFYDSQHAYVQLMSPMPYATFFAPATIRMWAHAPDNGSDGVNNYAPKVEFFLGTTMVGSVSIGAGDPIDYYETDITGVAAGSYELFARSHMASGTVDSIHVPITVIDNAATGPAMNLTSDVVLSGATSFELIGTASARAVLTSSNGSRIRSMPGWTGHLTIQHADIIGLGAMDVPSIEVAAQGPAPSRSPTRCSIARVRRRSPRTTRRRSRSGATRLRPTC